MSRSVIRCLITFVFGFIFVGNSLAGVSTRYVWRNSPNPDMPYTSWSNAAHDIQTAINAAGSGDTVLVTNGIYDAGGVVHAGSLLTNRVYITNAITLRSVNGAEFTSIVGSGPMGASAVRCAYLGTNATIVGFTLTNGHTLVTGGGDDKRGGGALLGPGSRISNCVVQGCSAQWTGGGVHCFERGTVADCIIKANESGNSGGGLFVALGTNLVRNCLIVGNQTGNGSGGGGISCSGNTIIESCTISGNHSDWRAGGCDVGQSGLSIHNSIIYDNTADVVDDNWGWDTNMLWAQNCYSVPILPGTNNFITDPAFAADDGSNYRLRYSSPCRDTGTNQAWMSSAYDIEGQDRINDAIVDVGAYEFKLGPLDCAISANPRRGAQALVVTFLGEAVSTNDSAVFYQWDFENDGIWDAWGTNAAQVTNTYEYPGYWSVALAVSNGIGETALVTRTDYIFVSPSNIYVSPSGSHDLPFTNWATAATNIQEAVNAGSAGSVILITNGTYVVTSAIEVSESVCVRGVNGRSVTIIDGNDSTRCVELDHPGAVIEELTITRGMKSDGAGVYCWEGAVRDCLLLDNTTTPTFGDDAGGGLYCVSGTVAGCTFAGNHASDFGGGAYIEKQALITNCTFQSNNSSYGGGLYTEGASTILASHFTGNFTTWRDGGGLYCEDAAELDGVTFENNVAERSGGGASVHSNAVLRNCTFNGNTATNSSGGGLACGSPATIYIYTCEFNNNTANDGGGMYAQKGEIDDSTFSNNRARNGGGISLQVGSIIDCDLIANVTSGSHNSGGAGCDVDSALISGCTINNNTAQGPGGGIYISLSSFITNCAISGNTASGGGGVRCGPSTTVARCTIENNTAVDDGGGGMIAEAGTLIDSCIVRDNLSANSFHTYAGGLYLKTGSICRNSLVYDNTVNSGASAYGGGIYAQSGATVDNCTVVANTLNKGGFPAHTAEGGGIYAPTSVTIGNCIIYYNTAEIDPNIDPAYAGTTFSCSTPTPAGNGNVPGPPQFVSYASRNLKLLGSSPGIDQGTASGATLDYDGVPRPLDGKGIGGAQWDMGAYEYIHGSADSDGDGLSDTNEIYSIGTDPTKTDTDGDSATDYEEIIADTDAVDAEDFFAVEALFINSPVITVRFDSSAARNYTLIMTENLLDRLWTNVPGMGPRAGVDGSDVFVVTNEIPSAIYSVIVEKP